MAVTNHGDGNARTVCHGPYSPGTVLVNALDTTQQLTVDNNSCVSVALLHNGQPFVGVPATA